MADEKELEKIRELSVQKRTEANLNALGFNGDSFYFSFDSSTRQGLISPWWSEQRDLDLDIFWMLEGNEILQGAISSMVKKFKAMNWVVDGPQRATKMYQETLAQSEFGKGWSFLLGKVLNDYLTKDKGAFIELIGEGDPNGEINGPVMGMAHLDSLLCRLTGNPEYPVIFASSKDKSTWHKLHASRVIHLVDMPSPREDMFDTGFCSTSRVVNPATVLLEIGRYKAEKLSDLPQAGLLLLNNILPQKWDDAKAEYNIDRRRKGELYWKSIMTLFGLDPANPASANFIPFASLPDSFDELQTTEVYLNILALAFGVDVREFWPKSVGSLGTGNEVTIQHEKAQGKGVGEIISQIEREINWKVLPEAVTFAFDFQDDAQDRQVAEINDLKIKSIMGMWQPPSGDQLNYGINAPVNRLEIRQMLADNVSYFSEEFLEVDITEDIELTDTERDKWLGNRVILDSKGRIKQNKMKFEERYDVIEDVMDLVEQNYKDGSISLDELIDFKFNSMLEERIENKCQ